MWNHLIIVACVLFISWIVTGTVMKTKSPIKTIRNKVKTPSIYNEMNRFDLEEK